MLSLLTSHLNICVLAHSRHTKAAGICCSVHWAARGCLMTLTLQAVAALLLLLLLLLVPLGTLALLLGRRVQGAVDALHSWLDSRTGRCCMAVRLAVHQPPAPSVQQQ
jgi:hypothetical protein